MISHLYLRINPNYTAHTNQPLCIIDNRDIIKLVYYIIIQTCIMIIIDNYTCYSQVICDSINLDIDVESADTYCQSH